eukprot:2397472-Alexandrium_andersonii.AAC.1
MGTVAPSEGAVAGVSGEATCAGGASSMARPSWYAKEVASRRSSGSTWRPRGSRLMPQVLEISSPGRRMR